MVEFYDHPETGETRFKALSGGSGGGQTSEFDVPATKAHIAEYPREHGHYLLRKQAAVAEAAEREKRDQHVSALSDDLAEAKASGAELAAAKAEAERQAQQAAADLAEAKALNVELSAARDAAQARAEKAEADLAEAHADLAAAHKAAAVGTTQIKGGAA